MASFQDYINTLKSGTLKPKIKIEWLRVDETVESEMIEDILGGSLTINRNNGIRRAIEFTIKNSEALLPNIYGIWLNKKLKLSLGYETLNGDWFEPQGIFVISNPNYTSSPNGSTVTINAVDKFSLLSGENGSGLLKDIYLIDNGTNINYAVQKILVDFKDPIVPILRPSTMNLPYTIRKGQGENVGEMLKSIAYASARNIYYDTEGRLVFDEDFDDNIKGSEWDFNFQDEKYTYLGSNLEHQFSNVRNYVKVIGQNINGAIVTGIAIDNDLTSPTNTNIIGEIPDIVANDYISTIAEAERLAKYKLKRLKVLNQAISIESIPLFHLDVDKVITLTDENYKITNQRYLVTSISTGLEFGSRMTIQCCLVDEIDFTVGAVD